ncbi:NAD-dependent epimerase/dehydratase family protein [Sporosarcina sp. FSL W7-1349]|uniref:NAD-dependent epimerase/dehydratase family protein n=1 Tax=Sporosarcina sp. FSL W7-1349 TaxID=2921561 RepID=UPI0030F74FE9
MVNKVLVTGGCGFIGSHVVKALKEKGCSVAIIDNLSTGSLRNISDLEAEVYQVSILNKSLSDIFFEFKPDCIIHLAAQGSVSKSLLDMNHDAEVNILGLLNLIDLAVKHDVEKFVFASSAAVYGEPNNLPITVDHELNPLSPYGLSKLTAEKYLSLASKNNGLNSTILRFSNVYGINQRSDNEGGAISIFIDNVLKGIAPTIHGDGNQTRDFINVKDVVNAIILAAFNETTGIFNVSSNNSIRVRDIVDIILRELNSNLSIKYEDNRIGDIKHSLLNNDKTMNILNWKPQINIREGIREIIELERKRK